MAGAPTPNNHTHAVSTFTRGTKKRPNCCRALATSPAVSEAPRRPFIRKVSKRRGRKRRHRHTPRRANQGVGARAQRLRSPFLSLSNPPLRSPRSVPRLSHCSQPLPLHAASSSYTPSRAVPARARFSRCGPLRGGWGTSSAGWRTHSGQRAATTLPDRLIGDSRVRLCPQHNGSGPAFQYISQVSTDKNAP